MRLIAALILTAAPAAALEFQSPSGNIHCIIDTYENIFDLRCDRVAFSHAPPRDPDCDLDWGHTVYVGATGPAIMGCSGDTIMNPTSFVLEYGWTIGLNGFSCTSQREGMTCHSPAGHGFFISRSRVDLF